MVKKESDAKNPNEMVFTKTKGFADKNYGVITSKVCIGNAGLSVERMNKILFFKGKPQTTTVDYDQIANIEVKIHFAKGDFISGIILGVFLIIAGRIFIGPIIIAIMVFCAYGKNIVITRKDLSKVVIMSEGFAEKEAVETFCKKLAEKGIAVYGGKK